VPAEFAPSSVEILRFLPETILIVSGALLMALSVFWRNHAAGRFVPLSLLLLLAAAAASVAVHRDPGPAFREMISADSFAAYFRVLVIAAAALTVLVSSQYLRRERSEAGEYYALILLSTAGQCIMASSSELIMLFIGLEISSLASYVLAGYLRDDRRANEAALKYFLLGSFATGFLLFGIAWTYGLTGSTFLEDIRAGLSDAGPELSPILLAMAAALVFVGLAFKISAWPFQAWTPDVYQGAPAPVAAFLAAGPKAAAFAVLIRIFMTAFEPMRARWEPLLWLTALVTMVIGNFAALTQTNIKRLLAYSSIAHAGYMLVAITAASETGVAAVLFYLAAYTLMNVGAFAVVIHVCRKGEQFVQVQDFSGLAERQPATAALFSLFLLSLVGIPLTAGFFGKFYIFKAALDANLIWLTVLGLLNSAVAAYYYLRILVVMYMHSPSEATSDLPPLGGALKAAVYASALGTLLLGVFPSLVLNFATKSAGLVR